MMGKIQQRVKKWYQGEYIPPDNSPNSPVFFVNGDYRRHWTSRLVHTAAEFYSKEWKWLLPFILGTIGTGLAVAKLFS
jgi:hypothetical protein